MKRSLCHPKVKFMEIMGIFMMAFLVFFDVWYTIKIVGYGIDAIGIITDIFVIIFEVGIIYVFTSIYKWYCWGKFDESGVTFKGVFLRAYRMEYALCTYVGVASYTFNPKSIMYYIVLSYDGFDENYRYSVQRWRTNKRKMIVPLDDELYEYLLSVLPGSRSAQLRSEYEKYYKAENRD